MPTILEAACALPEFRGDPDGVECLEELLQLELDGILQGMSDAKSDDTSQEYIVTGVAAANFGLDVSVTCPNGNYLFRVILDWRAKDS